MFQSVINIENDSEHVKRILSSLKKDIHFSKTFEGTAKNGVLKGVYTNLALINGIVIGFVKISGNYDLDKGNLNLVVKPSHLFLMILILNIILTSFILYPAFIGNQIEFLSIIFIQGFTLFVLLIYLIEKSSFIRRIRKL